MLSDLSYELSVFVNKSKLYLYPWILFFAGLWVFNIVNWLTGSKLNVFGIYPRRLRGLAGILFSPFIHQNFNHLFFNSIPLFALGLFILAQGLHIFLQVTLLVVLLGGFGVWLFARPAIHIGASGVVSGYFGFILATVYFNPSFTALLLALIVVYYFGSIFLGIFPQEDRVSWESHLFGFLTGIVSALIPVQMWTAFGFNFI